MPQQPINGLVAGLDVGGTAMKGLVLRGHDSVLHERTWPTPRAAGPDAIVSAVLDAAAEIVSLEPNIAAVGLVVPGVVDDAAGVAEWSENLGWRDVPFRSLVRSRTGLPVGFGHDVRAGGFAERLVGAAKDERNVLFMPIGTGISGAMTIEGVTLTGKFVGEVGHLDVGTGRHCACGGTGCLETIATGPSIARAYAERTGREVPGAREVFALESQGDVAAAGVIEAAVSAIAHALTEYITLLDPDVIVIGGGVGTAGERLLTPLRAAIAARLAWQRMPRLATAAFGVNAAAMGACYLALAECGTRSEASRQLESKESQHG